MKYEAYIEELNIIRHNSKTHIDKFLDGFINPKDIDGYITDFKLPPAPIAPETTPAEFIFQNSNGKDLFNIKVDLPTGWIEDHISMLTPLELKKLKRPLSNQTLECKAIRESIDECSSNLGKYKLSQSDLKAVRCMQYYYIRGWRLEDIAKEIERKYPNRHMTSKGYKNGYTTRQIQKLCDRARDLLYQNYWKDHIPIYEVEGLPPIILSEHLKGDEHNEQDPNDTNS